MKNSRLLALFFGLLSIIGLSSSCSKDVPPAEPTIVLELNESTTETISFAVTVTDATSAKYLVTEGTQVPTATEIFSEGIPVDIGSEQLITAEYLIPETTYTISIAAENESVTAPVKSISAQTSELPADPTAVIENTEATHNSITFSTTTENTDRAVWLVIKSGSREISIADAFEHGTEFEANTTVEITVENLDAETEYEIIVAAANDYCSILEFEIISTTREILTYDIVGDFANCTIYPEDGFIDFYVKIFNQENGLEFRFDFFDVAEAIYLNSGTYTMKEGATIGEIGTEYTALAIVDEIYRYKSAVAHVVATPNEETYEINYEITAELVLENTLDTINLTYNGPITGLKLPEPEEPESNVYVFVPDPSTKQPYRITPNGETPGEYYLKFIDSNWNELTLDIYLDPAICNNGNDGIPAGTYSIATGEIHDYYSSVSLYNPYFGGSFTECTLEVSVDGDQYTFIMNGTAVSGGVTKTIQMNWTGEVTDMVRQ